jgi:hypothetical protein
MRKYVYPRHILNLGHKQTDTSFSDELAKKWNVNTRIQHFARLTRCQLLALFLALYEIQDTIRAKRATYYETDQTQLAN